VTWITITAGLSGSGNGSVSYSVAVNPNPAQRVGTMLIAGITFTVTQSETGAEADPHVDPGGAVNSASKRNFIE